jgi:hypothetical protein
MKHRPIACTVLHALVTSGLMFGLVFGLLGCAPVATKGAPVAKQSSINFQSFINARGYKTVVVNAVGPFSEDGRIKPGSGQEWIVKLSKPGKRLTLGVISSRGSIDFLLHGARLTSNSPAHSDTSGSELKKLEFSNPAEGTYYVYALNRTRSSQEYTLVISLE